MKKIKINFETEDSLVPVIIQHVDTLQVLMLGYMNQKAYQKTKEEGKVTFYSRIKKQLWTKGEASDNFLMVKKMKVDCDNNTLLIFARPKEPICHTGKASCFGKKANKGFLYQLEQIIHQHIDEDALKSPINKLYKKGIDKMAQKVGEEAVELVIEAKGDNDNLFKNEAADLMYYYLVLLKAKGVELKDIEKVLRKRY